MYFSFTAVLSFAVFVILAWAIMDNQVLDGIFVKTGMSFIAIGTLALGLIVTTEWDPPSNSVSSAWWVMSIGVIFCAAGAICNATGCKESMKNIQRKLCVYKRSRHRAAKEERSAP
jgi:hypothetical protein